MRVTMGVPRPAGADARPAPFPSSRTSPCCHPPSLPPPPPRASLPPVPKTPPGGMCRLRCQYGLCWRATSTRHGRRATTPTASAWPVGRRKTCSGTLTTTASDGASGSVQLNTSRPCPRLLVQTRPRLLSAASGRVACHSGPGMHRECSVHCFGIMPRSPSFPSHCFGCGDACQALSPVGALKQ